MKKAIPLFFIFISLLSCPLSYAISETEGKPIPFKLNQNQFALEVSPLVLSQGVEELLFSKTNRFREENQLSLLNSNSLLTRVARNYSQDMLKRNYFSHFSPEKKDVLDRIRKLKSNYNESCGENLHFILSPNGLKDPTAIADQMMKDWIQSPPHHRNLASKEFQLLGLGCASDGKKIYCTQVFSGARL